MNVNKSDASSGQQSRGGSLDRGKAASAPGDVLPALPDSLLDALARDPPPHTDNSFSGHARLHKGGRGFTDASPRLPSLPPSSPLTVPYGSIESLRARTSDDFDRTSGNGNRRSPETRSGSASVNREGQDLRNAIDDSPRNKSSSASSRLWRSVGFGRQRSTEVSPASTPRAENPEWGANPSSSTATYAVTQHALAPAAPVVSRRPSSGRVRQSGPSSPSQWLFEAQQAVAASQGRTSRVGSGTTGLGLLEHVEGEQGTISVPLEELRRVSGGHGVDPGLDAMDDESDERPPFSSSRKASTKSANEASPWLSSSKERFTHDLESNGSPDSLEEGDDEEEGLEERPSGLDRSGTDGEQSITGEDVEVYRSLGLTADDMATLLDPVEAASIASRAVRPQDLAVVTSLDGAESTASPDPSAASAAATPRAVASERMPREVDHGATPRRTSLEHTASDVLGSERRRGSHGTSRQRTADFTVAVVGPRNVGKSSVIRRGLKRPSEKPTIVTEDEEGNRVTTSTSYFTISGQSRTIEVLEIDSRLLQFDDEGVVWPEGLPQCEGAMLCYDSTDPQALDTLSLLLQGFWTRGSDIPLIVLACKADPEPANNATDPNRAATVCNVYGAGIVALDGGIEDPKRKMKESFNWIIRQIMANRGEARRPSSAASSATTSRRGSAQANSASSSPILSRHGSLGGGPLSALKETSQDYASPEPNETTSGRSARSGSLGLGLSIVQEAPVGVDAGGNAAPSMTSADASAYAGDEVNKESVSKRKSHSGDSALLSEPKLESSKTNSLDLYFTREEMIDKFLFAAVTGNDDQYVTLFLIVFRRFARPYDVLVKLIERFDFVAGRLKTDPLLSRFAQQKLCSVLGTWLKTYPTDFIAPATLRLLRPFLEGLLPRGATWVAHYAVELLPLLPTLDGMADSEASWALPDRAFDTPIDQFSTYAIRRPSVAPSTVSSAAASQVSQASRDSVDDSLGPLDSAATTPGSTASRSQMNSSSTTLDTVDSSGAPAASVGSSSSFKQHIPAGAALLDVSNALIELAEDAIAAQITRIAWEPFSDMTPRDLMRHVLAPRDPKNPRAALRDSNSAVVRSINFVNYIADWVSTLILVQAKPKYRARILEKFITVAYSLRERENFDSLMGVLAGLNSQPVFRLTETMELVNLKLEGDRATVPKRLRSLNKLMAHTKSFSAYRMALASSANMLPYLGVHLQDITVVNEVKTDMRDGKVNWSKFSQMGRSAAIVLDCSRTAPSIPIDRGLERCIIGLPLLDKEQQYSLSYAYQPRAESKPVSSARRRLQNIAKSPFIS